MEQKSAQQAGPEEIPLLIFDGACGTTLQAMKTSPTDGQGWDGCHEASNLFAPDLVVAMHRAFVEAGAQVVETNTFGASRIVLAEYGLADRAQEINRLAVAHARRAIEGAPGRFVAGSVGPTTKLPSLGHISRDDLFAALSEQMDALLDAGIDLLILETCQDLLQLKCALVAAFEALDRRGLTLPVLASVTVERTGTLLVGTDLAAVCATLEPFPLFSLGLNCATGPADMTSHIRYLSQCWPGRISCMPNQGMPEVVKGQTVYPLTPEAYAACMRRFVTEYGVSVVGGCCGTLPAHTRALTEALRGAAPAARRLES